MALGGGWLSGCRDASFQPSGAEDPLTGPKPRKCTPGESLLFKAGNWATVRPRACRRGKAGLSATVPAKASALKRWEFLGCAVSAELVQLNKEEKGISGEFLAQYEATV